VIYAQRVFRGRFDACTVQVTAKELGQLLETAAAEARDFYERLLIEDLRDRLAERTST
jgi:hypothetical protein